MVVEIGYALIDLTAKSIVVVGLPCLIAALFVRRVSASEKFTLLMASMLAWLVLAVGGMAACLGGHDIAFFQMVRPPVERSPVILSTLVVVWITVAVPAVLLTTLRMLVSEFHCMRRNRKRATEDRSIPASVRLGRPVVFDVDCALPCVRGIWFQRIFLPPGFRTWAEADRCNVLLHEKFHVSRNDVLWKFLCQIVVALFWFNPLMWYAKYRISVEQEKACDNAVLRTGVPADLYCETILMVACQARHSPGLALDVKMSGSVVASGAPGSSLVRRSAIWRLLQSRVLTSPIQQRILSIIDPRVCRRWHRIPGNFLLAATVMYLSHTVFSYQWHDEVSVESSGPQIFECAIAASDDDAEEKIDNGSMDLDSRDLEICVDHSRERKQLVGLRFAGIEIPPDATVTLAEICFTGYGCSQHVDISQDNVVDVEIHVQLAPDVPSFTRSSRDISRRLKQRFEQSVPWTIGSKWNDEKKGRHTTTPNLACLVQAAINQPYWKTGDAIVFMLEAKSFDSMRNSAAYDNPNGIAPPTLRISWIKPGSKQAPSRN